MLYVATLVYHDEYGPELWETVFQDNLTPPVDHDEWDILAMARAELGIRYGQPLPAGVLAVYALVKPVVVAATGRCCNKSGVSRSQEGPKKKECQYHAQ